MEPTAGKTRIEWPSPGFTFLSLSLSLSPRFNGHFPGEPGLAGVY